MKIIKIKDCVDCPMAFYSNVVGRLYCTYKLDTMILLPESGIHPDCKLEDYKKVKK